MKDVKKIFRNLEKKLRASRWFSDDWDVYNRGSYLQVYKTDWYNGSQGGVHFETSIEGPQIIQKSFSVCLHAEEDCPSQALFIETLLSLEEDRIRSWKGYQIVGNGYSIAQKPLPLNFKNLEDRLLAEFNQLRQLEPSIDRVLDQL